MKPKKINKRLDLGKETIAHLDQAEARLIRGRGGNEDGCQTVCGSGSVWYYYPETSGSNNNYTYLHCPTMVPCMPCRLDPGTVNTD